MDRVVVADTEHVGLSAVTSEFQCVSVRCRAHPTTTTPTRDDSYRRFDILTPETVFDP